MTTVASEWKSYAKILPRRASLAQRVETRRAFYAGAAMMLDLMARAADLGEEAGCDKLESYHRELTTFVAGVGTLKERGH